MENNNSTRQGQVGGNHYKKLKIQPIEYAYDNKLDPLQFSIIKYVARFRDKGGKEDLEKARHCLNMLDEMEYGVQTESCKRTKKKNVLQPHPMTSIPVEEEKIVLLKKDGTFCVGSYCDRAWWVCDIRFDDHFCNTYALKYYENSFDGWYYMRELLKST